MCICTCHLMKVGDRVFVAGTSTNSGSYAQFVVSDATYVFPLHDRLSFAQVQHGRRKRKKGRKRGKRKEREEEKILFYYKLLKLVVEKLQSEKNYRPL